VIFYPTGFSGRAVNTGPDRGEVDTNITFNSGYRKKISNGLPVTDSKVGIYGVFILLCTKYTGGFKIILS
jgi:hypothetical protein